MKRIYVIMLAEANTDLFAKVQKAYQPSGDYFPISGTTAIVRSEHSARTIRTSLGIGESVTEDIAPTSGVVMRVNGDYSGFFDADLWHWLKEGAGRE